jgi:hypothetical protein
MAAIDNYNLAMDADFRKKVQSLMLKSALAVAGEDPTDKQDPYIRKRANSANFTIYNQDKAVNILSHLITSMGTLDLQSTDNDIEFMINSVWDDYSNILYSETI